MLSGPFAPTPIADVRRCFAPGVICDGFSDRVFQAVNKQCLMVRWMSGNVCGPQAWWDHAKHKMIVEQAVANQVVDMGLLTQTAEPPDGR
jgi:hypothetical protein